MRRFILIALATAAFPAAPLLAQQQSGIDGRVTKLEKEMKAVQRKVFPGGSTQYFEPEITPPQAAPAPAPGTPASSPVADLTARVDALESQLASLTGQAEQNAFKIRQIEDAFNKYKADTDARLAATAPPPAVTGGAIPGPMPAAAAPAPVNEARKAAVAAVERPNSGDAAEDAYMYGYRLWAAKFYPEAEVQLKSVVDKYPGHRRASFAQNLLGRSYLDAGKPALASVAFYENYQKRPQGERAPDSLAYLGQALVQLKKPKDACKVYDEFEDVYGATASASLKDIVAKGRTTAQCAA
jgi:TolA-binding protein